MRSSNERGPVASQSGTHLAPQESAHPSHEAGARGGVASCGCGGVPSEEADTEREAVGEKSPRAGEPSWLLGV